MKSGSWASHQAALPVEARAGGEPDEPEPKPVTIPATPTPGHRFMERQPYSWGVYDWQTEGCACVGTIRDKEGYPIPHPCKGTGDDGVLVPYLVAADLAESDARMLAFGPALVVAADFALSTMYDATEFEQRNVRGLREALRDVRGK
jgi:hypothetical protein